jgi:cell division protein FtsQ
MAATWVDAATHAQSLLKPLQPRLHGIGVVVLGGFFLVIITWSVKTLMSPEVLPIRHVRVSGDFNQVTANELYQAIAEHAVGGFFTVDVLAIEQAASKLSWVQSVSVRRVWPDTLRVKVREQKPLAHWSDGALINASGDVFQPISGNVPDDLPVFSGPQGSRGLLVTEYKKLQKHLNTVHQRVAYLSLDQRRAWRARLDNGIELIIGRSAPEQGIERYIKVFPSVLSSKVNDIERVDLRYTNGFAVRWKTENKKEG